MSLGSNFEDLQVVTKNGVEVTTDGKKNGTKVTIKYLLEDLFKNITPDLKTYPYDPIFRNWHVEMLLQQAAELLQRCLTERDEYFSLQAQYLSISRDISLQQAEIGLMRERQKTIDFEKQAYMKEEAIRLSARTKWLFQRLKEIANEHWEQVQNKDTEGNLYVTEANRDLNIMMGEMADFRKLAMHNERLSMDANTQLREHILDNYSNDLKFSLYMVNRCAKLIEHIKADFLYALKRLIPASEGLVNYFDYPDPIVEKITFNHIEEWSNIDFLVTWTRNAIQWLAAFSQNDQYFVFPISLSKKIGKDHFIEAISLAQNNPNNKGNLILSFPIGDELTSTHFLLRINGVSMYVYTRDKTDRVWRAKLEIPKVGVSVREDGKNFKIPQINFPPVYFGRITHRNSPTGAELVGTNSICNASPICPEKGVQWVLQIYSQNGDGSDFNSLEDIEVELHLSGIPNVK